MIDFFTGTAGFCDVATSPNAAAGQAAQHGVDTLDDRRKLADRHGIVADVSGDDITCQFEDVVGFLDLYCVIGHSVRDLWVYKNFGMLRRQGIAWLVTEIKVKSMLNLWKFKYSYVRHLDIFYLTF